MNAWIICPNEGLIKHLSDSHQYSFRKTKFGWITECSGNNGRPASILISSLTNGIENLVNQVLAELTFQRIYLIDTCLGNKKDKKIKGYHITDVLVESAMFCGDNLDYRRIFNSYRSPYAGRYDERTNFKGDVVSSYKEWENEGIFEYAKSYNNKIGILDKYSYDFYKAMNASRSMIPFVSVLGLSGFVGDVVSSDKITRAIQISFLRVISDIVEKVRGTGNKERMVVVEAKPLPSSSGDTTLECKICFDRKIDSVFLPCGHAVSCRNCAIRHTCSGKGRHARCMVCNQEVFNVNDLFLS